MNEPTKAIQYIIDTAPLYAKAKADRMYLDDVMTTENEQWMSAIGFPEYEVSSLGNVRRIKKSCVSTPLKQIKPWRMKNGYMLVALSSMGKKKYFLVHRLVFQSFNGSCDGFDVCHNNGIRSDNRLENLRSDTRKGNMSDIYKHDTHIRGERCGTNKYKTEQIVAFKQDVKNGMSVASAARKNQINRMTAYNINDKRSWAWL